mmetsp:Transcript_14160/g.34066  ORF Transcript_14160/g.34066 Transcript_14160/m.34066 type:complete len:488 (+) Transcript_14160:158-1621(+)
MGIKNADILTATEVLVETLSLESNNKAELIAAPAAAVAATPQAPDPAFTFSDARLHSPSKVQVTFGDGTSWLFHSGWLIDSCRGQLDEGLNRNATLSAVTAQFFNGGTVKPSDAESVTVTEGGDAITVKFAGAFQDDFTASFLRSYAPIVAKALNGEQPEYFTKNPLNASESYELWDKTLAVPTFQYADLAVEGTEYVRYCHAVVSPGVAIVQGMPDDDDATGKVVSDSIAQWFGKLMQHPERDTNHWLISSQGYTAKGNSQGYNLGNVEMNPAYNTNLRLLNHTDQVSYGGPGFLLAFHCVTGSGINSVVDGFKVAEIMRIEHPEFFTALCKPTSFGRRISHYRQPIDQHVFEPIFTLDSYGKVVRVRFNEILRGPIAMPFEEFEEYFAAVKKFVELANSDELSLEKTLQKGECIVFNNWRAMHGRKTAGPTRIIVGGTVALESFKSKMRLVFDKSADAKTLKDRIGVPEAVLAKMMNRNEMQIIR